METTSGIKFKKSQLASYDAITTPGKYYLTVSNDVTEKNLVTPDDGSSSRYIVGFKAIPEDKLGQVKAAFKDADEIDIEKLNGSFLTGNIWLPANGNQPALPVKGEKVECIVDYVKLRDSEEMALRVTNMKVREAQKAAKLDVAALFAETETANTDSTLQHS